MDLQKRFDIAMKLWEIGISTETIRFCSLEELISIQRRTSTINLADLEVFADEVFDRSGCQARQAQQERDRRSQITVLVTDDRSQPWMTARILQNAIMPFKLSGISLDFRLVFRVRNKALAKRCGEILGCKVEATQDPIPTLKKGDEIFELLTRQIEQGSDSEIVCTQSVYLPD